MLACQASCRGFKPRLPLHFRKKEVMGKRYNPGSPWKKLIKFLNARHSVDIKVIENYLYHHSHHFYMREHLKTLIQLRFCVKKCCINQNKTTTTKIILKRRIPKKLTEELAKEMLQKPWLSWFMFPE